MMSLSLYRIRLDGYETLRTAWGDTDRYEHPITKKVFLGRTKVRAITEGFEYLAALCREAKIDYADVDCNDFVDPELTESFGAAYLTDKKKINEAFAKMLAKKQALIDGNLEPFSDDIANSINSHFSWWRQNEGQASSPLEELLRVLRERARQYEDARSNVIGHYVNQQELSGVTTDVAKGLTEAFRAVPFFKFVKFQATDVVMVTTADCILEEKNPSAGVHHTFNFGRFRIHLNMANMRLRVFLQDDNTISANYYHPHINHQGDICWGNAGDRIQQARLAGDFLSIFRIMAALLTSYSREAPYRPLHTWVAEKEARDQQRSQTRQATSGIAQQLTEQQSVEFSRVVAGMSAQYSPEPRF